MCVATATATAENSLMMTLRNKLIFVFVHYGAVVSNFSRHRYHH